MRPLAALAIVLLAASCGPSPSQLRLQRVQSTRAGARQLAGPRQASSYAEALHAASLAGDYRANPQALAADTADAIAILDRAMPSSGAEAPTLVAWRGLMFLDAGHPDEALAELERSFRLGPTELAGRTLVIAYGGANQPRRVGQICAATVGVVRSDDDKLSLIALCRTHMNAVSPEGEMAWMSADLVAWYQAENARRIGAEIDAINARQEREREDQRVVRQTEQCSASCKEDGLYCQNDCAGDRVCENRCVQINHACVDRCGSRAMEKLGY
jgi:hypothetical protein